MHYRNPAKTTLNFGYMLVVTTLLFPLPSVADGNGVAILSNAELKLDPLVVEPAEPFAFESFTIELHTPDAYPPARTIYVDIEENDIEIEFIPGYSGIVSPHILQGMRVEMQGLPAGQYTIRTLKREPAESGYVDDITYYDELTFTVLEAEPTQRAYTFYSDNIDHYFVTNDPDEVYNAPVGVWFPADRGFNVWPAEGPAPQAAQSVCRFYSQLVNSHFYTASEDECATLQEENTGWEYEGIAFRALVPVDGACQPGTTSVWRLFNNRAEELDSNHRFVTSMETYRVMIADGWVGEGVAFCSPPESE